VPLGFFPTIIRSDIDPEGVTELGVFLVTSPTEAWFFRNTPFNPSANHVEIQQVIIKFTNANFVGGPNGTFTMSSPKVYIDESDTAIERADGGVALSGSFTSLSGISFAFSRTPLLEPAFTGTGAGNYGPLNFQNATLADITGNWTIQDASTTDAGELNQGTATISAAGVISGLAIGGSCTLSGQLSDPETKPDVLTITSLSLTGASCPANIRQNDTGVAFKLPPNSRPIHPNVGGTVGDYYGMLLIRDDGSDAALIYLRRQ
jgi:hypothetical protein